jgi:hypothetical protein
MDDRVFVFFVPFPLVKNLADILKASNYRRHFVELLWVKMQTKRMTQTI